MSVQGLDMCPSIFVTNTIYFSKRQMVPVILANMILKGILTIEFYRATL